MKQPLAYVHPDAKIAESVVIDPFVTIDQDVEIGEGTRIGSGVTILPGTRIGKNCRIFPGAVIGAVPQDLKFRGEYTKLEIGDNNTIREFVTINRGTSANGKTIVGSNNLIMAYVHIAHDCVVGNNIILVNNTQLAGEVIIDDFAILGGMSAVHQFVHIGPHVMISGGSLPHVSTSQIARNTKQIVCFGTRAIHLISFFDNAQSRDADGNTVERAGGVASNQIDTKIVAGQVNSFVNFLNRLNRKFRRNSNRNRDLRWHGIHGANVGNIHRNGFVTQGIPTRKNENYKYTNLHPSFANDYTFVHEKQETEANITEIFRCNVPDLNTQLTLLYNGWFYEKNNLANKLPAGVVLESLEKATSKYANIIEKHYASLADTTTDAMIALNTALAKDGYFLFVPKNVVIEKPIQIINLLKGDTDTFSTQRNLVIVEEGAEAQLI
ncbi:hypothetical protein B566_EDAN019304, partial [Ephemera danica]